VEKYNSDSRGVVNTDCSLYLFDIVHRRKLMRRMMLIFLLFVILKRIQIESRNLNGWLCLVFVLISDVCPSVSRATMEDGSVLVMVLIMIFLDGHGRDLLPLTWLFFYTTLPFITLFYLVIVVY
jgi:hypothetical protein